jgi:hypothetical protein
LSNHNIQSNLLLLLEQVKVLGQEQERVLVQEQVLVQGLLG